jgi:hypothetical protein
VPACRTLDCGDSRSASIYAMMALAPSPDPMADPYSRNRPSAPMTAFEQLRLGVPATAS